MRKNLSVAILLYVCSLLLCVLSTTNVAANIIKLNTRAPNPLRNSQKLQDFLSRPIHWPQIVASSNGVHSETMDVTQSMRPGQYVDEIFGMGLLSVSWTCRKAQPGMFVVEAREGVPGIAVDCSMTFEIREEEVNFTMGFTSCSPLAYLATPVLVVDNWLALNVLLKAAVDPTPLNSFRQLMGILYGSAGVAHALDLWFGGSVLFTSVGIPAFEDLTIEGQALAVLWCAVGPLAYFLSRKAPSTSSSQKRWWQADLGLVAYGLVEVLGAFLSANQGALTNAVGVQVVVLATWVYSQQKQSLRHAQTLETSL